MDKIIEIKLAAKVLFSHAKALGVLTDEFLQEQYDLIINGVDELSKDKEALVVRILKSYEIMFIKTDKEECDIKNLYLFTDILKHLNVKIINENTSMETM